MAMWRTARGFSFTYSMKSERLNFADSVFSHFFVLFLLSSFHSPQLARDALFLQGARLGQREGGKNKGICLVGLLDSPRPDFDRLQ